MSSGQKVIKICAIAFAVFLIVNIVSAVIAGLTAFCGIMYAKEDADKVIEGIAIEEINGIENLKENVKIKVELEMSHLEIKDGTSLKVEKINTSSHFKCMVHGNELTIKEENSNWFRGVNQNNSTIVLYIPKNITLDELELEMGIGKANIENIEANKIDIKAGAGKMMLNRVIARKANIDGGAGSLTINHSNLYDLDLDCGVGVVEILGDIQGNSQISCGVGKTEIHLTGEKDNYTIMTETGLGNMTLNGEKCYHHNRYGNGASVLKVEGGVGSVEITTK